MSDAIDSDDERYANASFENDTDEEIPEMTDLESETENSGNEDDALPSAKANAVCMYVGRKDTKCILYFRLYCLCFA